MPAPHTERHAPLLTPKTKERDTNSSSDTKGQPYYSPGSIPGEYKMKEIRPLLDEAGNQVTEPSWKDNGEMVGVWELDVNFFWYDQQFDSDVFLVKVPFELGQNPDDVLRINYTVYSLIEEDFAPTQVMLDALVDGDDVPARGGSARFPFKGQDTVWARIQPETVTHMTVQHTALRFFRGIYSWGWNVHPPRIHFIQFLFQIQNAHTGKIEWDWQSQSFTARNQRLTLDGIGDAAPEKKVYQVATAALDDATTVEELLALMEVEDASLGTRPIWATWIDLMANQRQLPPEARDILAAEGKTINSWFAQIEEGF